MFFIVPFALDGKICFMVEIKIKLKKKKKSESQSFKQYVLVLLYLTCDLR